MDTFSDVNYPVLEFVNPDYRQCTSFLLTHRMGHSISKAKRLMSIQVANNSSVLTNTTVEQYSNTHSSTLIAVNPRNSTPITKYRNNEDALKDYSPFYNHTYDAHFQYPVAKHNLIGNIRLFPWNDSINYASGNIRLFPWNDSINYASICQRILRRITQNNTYYIISGSLIGGLGHKYLSVFHSITYAILLGRRFLRKLDWSVICSSSP